MYQPKCGFPYEEERYRQQVAEMVAQENGLPISCAGRLNGLAPRLLGDAGFGGRCAPCGVPSPNRRRARLAPSAVPGFLARLKAHLLT